LALSGKPFLLGSRLAHSKEAVQGRVAGGAGEEWEYNPYQHIITAQ